MSAARTPLRPVTRRPSLAFSPELTPISLAMCLLVASPLGFALPTGPVNTSGQATVQTTTPGQMLIQQATAKAALDWTQFSIAAGERVQVVQPDRTSVLLNRVVGDSPSLIYGALQSNGSVWLINPRGIVFGASSRVDVGSLVASTLGIGNDVLQSGRLQLGAGAGGAGELRSEGSITATDGSVVLVAPHLVHGGQIEARRVGLAAASEVLVDVEGDGLIFFNVKNESLDTRLQVLGGVRADGGSAEFRAVARAGFADTVLNLEGVVQARSLGQQQGRIVVDGGGSGITRVAGSLDATGATAAGGDVLVQGNKILLTSSAQIDTSGAAGGGRLRVGGGFQGNDDAVRNASMVSVAPGARLSANATADGHGGEVIVWSDDATRFHGRADSRGGSQGGNGGLVEVSGKAYLDFRGTSDRSAPRGNAGLLLLDPGELTIRAANPDVNGNGGVLDLDAFGVGPGATLGFADGGAISFITAGQVVTQMLDGNVVLQATENINVTAGINSVSGFSLSLFAGKSINVNSPVSVTGSITLSVNDPGAPVSRLDSARANIGASLEAGGVITIINNSGSGVHNVAANLTAASLSVTGGIDISGPSVWRLSGSQLLGNIVTGAGTLEKAGAGVLTLSAASAYTGAVSVTQGGLSLSGALGSTSISLNGGNLGTSAADLLADGAALAVNTGSTLTLIGTDTIGALTLGGGALAGSALTVAGAVTSTATGTLPATLASAGSLIITNGTLTVSTAVPTNTITLSGGNLTTDATDLLRDAATVTVDTGSALTLGGNDAVATLSLGGNLALGGLLTAVNVTLTGGAAVNSGINATTSLSSSGTTAINSAVTAATTTVTGGTLTLGLGAPLTSDNINLNGGNLVTSATNLLADTANLTVGSGSTLTLGGADTIATLALAGTVAGSGTLTATTLTANGSAAQISLAMATGDATVQSGLLTVGNGGAGSLDVSGALTVGSGAVLAYNRNIPTTLSTNISGGGTVRFIGGAVVNFDANANALAVLEITGAGTDLRLGNGDGTRIGNNTAVSVGTGATLTLGNRDETVGSLDLSGTFNGSDTLTAGSYTLRPGALVGGRLGSGTLLVSGSGTATLNAVKGSGSITVNANATLQLGASANLNNNTDVTVQALGSLILGANDQIDNLTLAGTLDGAFTLTASGGTVLQTGALISAATDLAGGEMVVNGTATLAGRVDANVRVNSGGALSLTADRATATPGLSDHIGDTRDVNLQSGGSMQLARNEVIDDITGPGTLIGPGVLNAVTLTLNDGESVGNRTATALISNGATFITGTVNITGAGVATINSGILTVGQGSAAGSLEAGGGIVINSGAVLSFNRNNTLLLSSTVSGAGTLRQAGSTGSELQIGGVTSVAAINVASGTLSLVAGDNTRLSDSALVSVASGATLRLDNVSETVGSLNLAGTLGGAGTLNTSSISASGTAAINSAATATTTTVTSGTLTLAAALASNTVDLSGGNLTTSGANRLADTTTVTVDTGSTLTLGGTDTIATLSLGGNLASGSLLSAANVNLSSGATVNSGFDATTALNSTGATSINSAVTATAATVTGGTMTLAAALASNTVNLSGGNLITSGADRLANSATVTVNTGSTLTLGGADTIATLSLGGNLALGSMLTAANVNLGNGATVNSGFNATAALGSTGATAINSAATATTTTITGGTLTLAAALASNTVNLSGGNLTTSGADRLADTATFTLTSGTLTLGGTDTIGALTLVGGVLAGSAMTVAGAVTNTVDGNLPLTLALAGSLVLNAGTLTASTLVPTSTITLSGGNLHTTVTNLLADNAAVTINTGSTLTLDDTDTIAALTLGGGILAGSALTVTGAITALAGGTLSSNLASAGSLIVSGGTLTVSALVPTNTVTLSGGNLTTTAANLLLDTANIAVSTGSTLTLGGADTIATLLLGGNLAPRVPGGMLTTSGLTTLIDGATVNSGLSAAALTSSGTTAINTAVTVAGASTVTSGTLSLSATLASNTINLSGGNLSTGAANLLDNTAQVVVNTGSTLTLGGTDTVATLTLGGVLVGPTLSTSGLSTLSDGASVNGGLSAAALTSSGATVINGAVVVSGNTDILNGTLVLAGPLNSSTVKLSGGNLTTNAADLITDTAVVTVNTGRTLTLGGADTIATLSLSGNLGAGGSLTTNVSTTLSNGATVNAALAANALTSSGNVTLNNAVTVSNAAQVTNGVLTVGNGATAGSLTAATITVNNPGVLVYNRSDLVSLGSVGGTGTVRQSGSGNLSLVGRLSTAALLVDNGSFTLTVGDNNRIGDSTTVTVGAGTFTGSNASETFASLTLTGGSVGGASALTVTGAVAQNSGNSTLSAAITAGSLMAAGGSLTLANTLNTNNINLNGGNLSTNDTNLLADIANITVNTGSTLTLGGADIVATLTLGGSLSGGTLTTTGTTALGNGASLNSGLVAASLTSSGATAINGAVTAGSATVTSGTLTLAGVLTSNAVNLSGGNLVTSAANLLADTANLTVNTGRTLTLGGADTVATLALGGNLAAGAGTLTTAGLTTLSTGATVNGSLSAAALTASGSTAINTAVTVSGTTSITGGTLTLAGALASSSVTLSGGNLSTTATNVLADTASVLVNTGSTLTLGGADTIATLSLGGTLAGSSLTTTGTTALTNGAAVDGSLNAASLNATGTTAINSTVAVAGAVSVTGGSLTLAGVLNANTVNLSGGDLRTSAANRLADTSNVTVASGRVLTLGGADTVATLSLGGSLAAGGRLTTTGLTTLTNGATVGSNLVAAALTSSGAAAINAATSVTGTAAVTGGNLTLAAALDANTLALAGGNLGTSAGNLLADTTNVTVATGSTLTLGGADSVATLSLGGILGAGGPLTTTGQTALTQGAAVNGGLNAATLTSSGSTAINTAASVTGSTLVTSGTLTLAAALSSYTVQLSGGNLSTSAPDLLADAASVSVAMGSTLTLGGADTVANLTLAGRLAGVGQTLTATTLTTLQAGAVVDANLAGTTLNVAGNATLNGTAANRAINVNSGTLVLGSSGRLNNSADLTVANGATLLLAGTETVGTLTVAGTLGNAGGLLNAATYTLQNSALVQANLGAGTLASTGSVTLAGTSAANTVNVNTGTLSLASANLLADTATVTVLGPATLLLNGDDTVFRLALSGLLGGTGTLSASIYTLSGGTYNTPLGGGDLTVSANSTLNATSAATTVTVDGGTLTLGAANRFTALPAVTLNTGTGLALGGAESFGSLSGAGTVTLGSFTLTHLGLADSNFGGSLGVAGDTGGLVKLGSSNFTVAGTGFYRGNTRVEAGTLTLAGSLASLSLDVNGGSLVLTAADRLADAAAVTVRNDALFTLSGNETVASLALTGTLGVSSGNTGTFSANLVAMDTGIVNANLGGGNLTATGTSVLNGTSAATTLAVNGGTLTLTGADRLTAAPATTVANAATLLMQGGLTLGNLAGGGNVNLGSFTLTTGSAGDSSYSGVLSGSGGLTKTGTSVFTLGGSNSYIGATQVLAGSLVTSAADVLPNSTALTVASGATLTLGNNDSVATLLLNGALQGSGTLTAASYALNGGNVTSALGTGVLSSTGSSSLGATSAATTVVVSSGTLTLTAANLLADGAAVSVASGATLALSGNDSVASLTLAGTLGLTPGNSGTLTASSYTLDGATVDANLGAGTLASSGNSTLAGSAAAGTVQVNGGTLSLASAGRLADTAQVAVASGATLRLNGDDGIGSLALAGTLDGNGRLSASTISLNGGNALADVGATTLGSTGSSRLAGGADVGALNVDSGTLTLASTAALSATSATHVATGATLALGGNQSLGTLAGAGSVGLGSFTLTTGSGGSSRFDGLISGTGGLDKAGTGTFTLGGANAYSGATTVSSGTLATAGADVLPDASATRVASGATLQLGGNDSVATLLLNGTLQGIATLTATTYTLDGGNAVANLGAGRLVSIGSSTLAGSAAATDVAVNSGTLVLAAANRLADSATVAIATGATLQLGGDDTVARADIAGTLAGTGTLNAATVALNGGRVDAALGGGVLSSSGNSLLNATSAARAVNVDGGTLTLGAAQRLLAAPSLMLAAGSRIFLAGDETLGTLTGAGNLTLGATTLRTGSSGDSSYAGSITGTGRLVKQGSGVFTLSGAHAYSGSTTVEAGTLALAGADLLPDSSAVAVAAGATLALAGNETVASLALAGTLATAGGNNATLNAASYVLDGGNAIASLGAGSLQSTGASRLGGSSGATTVQVTSGTLALAAANRLADNATVTVASGATLTLAGNDSIASLALAGTLAVAPGNTGTLTAARYSLTSATVTADLGSGALRSAGSSRLDGRSAATTLTVDGGSLTLGAADRLADSMAVTVASGAALVINASDTVASLALAGTLSGSGTLKATNTLLDGGRVDANLGAGTLTSRGNSTLAGTAAAATVVVDGGTLTLASAQRLVALPALQVNGGASLAFNGSQALGSLAGDGNLALASFTLTTGSGGDSIFAGVISGNGGLIKQGSSSVFTLTGSNSYTGVTRIDAGTLRVGNGGASGSLASGAFQNSGTLSLVRSDNVTLAQPVSGSGNVEQAGNGRLLFSGNNKTYTGNTIVTNGELATAGADELPDSSNVRVAASGRLALGGRETVRSVEADGSISLGSELVASGDLLMRGAVSSAGAVQLSGQRIAAPNEGNRFAGTVSVTAGGELSLSSGRGTGGTGAGTRANDLVLGNVNAAAGGRIDGGLMSLTGVTTVTGGTLALVAAAPLTAVEPDADLRNREAASLPIAFAADALVAQSGSRLNVAAGAGLNVVASNSGSVQLLNAGNSFLGNLSVLSGAADTPWSVNSTALNFGGATLNYAVQSRVRITGDTVNIGGAGIVADVVAIRADRVSTSGTATIVARLPFDSTAGTATALPALTLEITPAAFALSFPFGAPGAEGGLRVSVGSREYGNRVLPLDAGFVTVLPRDGASGATAVLLRGPVVNPSGGYRFFFDGAGSQTQIPVFYNGVLPTTPQVENSISATVAVSEGARKAGFDDAVRTENVALRLRAGVIAEVGPAPSATQGTEGLRVPASCTPAPAALLCGDT